MHNVVMQAGQDKIASLDGTFSTSCLDIFDFFLFAVDESCFSPVPATFEAFLSCTGQNNLKRNND